MKKSNFLAVIIIVVFSVFFAYNLGEDRGEEMMRNDYESVLIEKDEQIQALVNMGVNYGFYYAEANILSQEEKDNFFEVSWVVNYNEEQVFLTYNSEPMEEDNIYLLTMNSMGTKDILDDEICVIWGAVNTMQ